MLSVGQGDGYRTVVSAPCQQRTSGPDELRREALESGPLPDECRQLIRRRHLWLVAIVLALSLRFVAPNVGLVYAPRSIRLSNAVDAVHRDEPDSKEQNLYTVRVS